VDIRKNGKTAGILVNFACHCDNVGSETAISADYPGELRRRLKAQYGEEVIVLFLQGPCGDINPVDAFRAEETKRPGRHLEIGKALAEEVIKIMSKVTPSESTEINAVAKDVDFPLQLPDEKKVAWAENIAATVKEDVAALGNFDHDQVDLFFAKKIIDQHELQQKTQTIFFQAVKIGDLCIYASPGELFSKYGDELVAQKQFKRVWVATLANDYVSYIVTPECMVEGVYEARQTYFPPDGGELMNQELLHLGDSLRE
jgi:hypothetical protein